MKILIYIFCLTFPILTLANNTIDISGFITIAASRTDNSESFYYRHKINNKINYVEDTLVGLNFSSKITDNLLAVIQLLYKKTLDSFQYYPKIEMAFLRYRLYRSLFLKAGKIKLPIWMISDYRNVGFLYPWIIPPEELYEQVPIDEITGLQISYNFPVSSFRIGLNGLYGNGKTTIYYLKNLDIPALGIRLDNYFEGMARVRHINMSLELKKIKFKISYTQLRNDNKDVYDQVNFYNTLNGASGSFKKDYNELEPKYNYLSIGLKGQYHKIEILSELGRSEYFQKNEQIWKSTTEYITFTYKWNRFVPHFTFLYGINSLVDPNKFRPNQFFTGFPTLPPSELKVTSFALGINYLVTNHSSIKLQLKNIHLRGSSPNTYLFTNTYSDKERFFLYSVSFNAIF